MVANEPIWIRTGLHTVGANEKKRNLKAESDRILLST